MKKVLAVLFVFLSVQSADAALTTQTQSFSQAPEDWGDTTGLTTPPAGIGTFDIEVSSIVDLGSFSMDLPVPFESSQQGLIQATFNGELSVTYEYTPAPGALLGGILDTGLAGWLRRRKTL